MAAGPCVIAEDRRGGGRGGPAWKDKGGREGEGDLVVFRIREDLEGEREGVVALSCVCSASFWFRT